MADLDLDNPGKIWASADNAADYTFYVILDKPWYNIKAFEANPNCVAGKDLFFRSPVQPDESGHSKIDLDAVAEDLRHKMKDAATAKGKLVCVSSSKADNEDPHKRMAVMEPCEMHKEPPKLKITIQDDKKIVILNDKVLFKIELKGMAGGCRFEVEPRDTAEVNEAQALKSAILELHGKKNGKFTLTAKGTSTGGTQMTEKVDLECEGPKLVMKGMGYIDQA